MAITEIYVRADANGSGDGTTDANSGVHGSFTWAQMLADATAGSVRYNLKSGVGTYSFTSATDTFTTAGATASPRYLRGFHTTLGDLEPQTRTAGSVLDTTNFPQIQYTTGGLTLPNFLDGSSFSITTARSGASLTTGQSAVLRKVSAANTSAAASTASAINAAANTRIEDCDGSVSSSSSSAAAFGAVSTSTFSRCLAIGNTAGAGGFNLGAGIINLIDCMIRDAGYGVQVLVTCHMDGVSFRNIANACIGNGSLITAVNCVAWGNGTTTKWYNSTTSVRVHYQNTNFVGNMGGADTNLGDWPVVNQVPVTADPFMGSSDLRLNNTAGGGAVVRNAGYPTYLDGGALQAQRFAGGSSTFGG